MADRTLRGADARSAARRRARAFLPALVLAAILGAAAAGAASGASRAVPRSSLALAAKQPVPAGAPIEAAKSLLGKIAQSDPALVARTDATPVNVVVKLDYDSVASYRGNIPGLAATSPRSTGDKLGDNLPAVHAYTSYAIRFETEVLERVRERVPEASVRGAFRTVYGGVALTLPANAVRELLAVEGVVAVQEDALRQPLTDTTPGFVRATEVWDALGGSGKAGEGVVVGVLDTGIWPEHPSFADHGLAPPRGGPFGCEFGVSGQPDDAAFACNDKLVGAYAFTDGYTSVIAPLPGEFCDLLVPATCSARDADGHGTHTSSTAAGGPVAAVRLFGVDRGHVSGMAPGAHVIMYRVCLDQGCVTSDSVAAVDQAIADGVDVLNFSISGGSNPYTDPVELAFLEAYDAGILVNAPAGNSGPAAGTASHAGPWVNTVAASTSSRHFFSTLQLTAAGGRTLELQGVTVTDGISKPADVVLASALSGYDVRCLEPAPDGAFAGKVVVCERGVNARVDKGFNVLAGGAAGMILYNTGVQQLNSDNHWLPALHLEGPSASGGGPASQLLEFLGDESDVRAVWPNGEATPVRGDVIASFSSRGPVGDFLKPDVTAPGVQILAGHTPDPHDANTIVGPPGELFQAIAGTSMSSPHAAGVAALIKALHADWTPGQIKSALVTSAVQDVLEEDGSTPSDPFDRGAGSIRADRAASPTVTFDVPAADYFASAADPLGRIHLNLPSIYAGTMSGEVTTWRMLRNVSGREQELEIATQAPEGAEILVQKAGRKGVKEPRRSDGKVTVGVGKEQTLQITIRAPELPDGGPYFGAVVLDPRREGDSPASLPVAFFKQQGAVTLHHGCDPATLPRRTRAACEVKAASLASVEAETAIEVRADKGLAFSSVSAPAEGTKRRITWSGTLSPALAPTVDAITPGGSPAGFLPLSAFGVAPIPGFGDETIVNLDLPLPISFGAESYARIGVVSNGYAVLGGGAAEAIDFVPQTFPDAARPNNVLAPFWTDLDLEAGGQVRAAYLGTDADCIVGDCWLVLEWLRAKVASTTQTPSFQIWIGVAGDADPGDDVTYAYGEITGDGDPAGLNVGAENRDGSSGVNLGATPATDDDYTIETSPPVAGGTTSFTYDASARKAGTYRSTATLTSSVTVGKTQVVQTLTVTP